MGEQARQILEDALRLPADERATVASELLRSLDEATSELSQDEVDRRWAEEITRRAQRARSGESDGIEADKVLGELEATLDKP